MSIEGVLEKIKNSARFLPWITAGEVIPERKGIYEDFPDFLNDRLKQILKNRGIEKLYSHQASAVKAVQNGDNIVVVTPTASGKTMCYNLPVLNTILQDSNSRALYLFPTKALSQDQVAELHELIEGLDIDIKIYTYDGDTPQPLEKP
jgi:DEAD/DEAH box helicase domain-containing protein